MGAGAPLAHEVLLAKSLRLLVRAAASPSAPSPLRGEGWGKNAPGEHYKGRRPVDSPAVIHALVRTRAYENDLPHPYPYFHRSILQVVEPISNNR